MHKILVVNVNWLGDVIFSSPVFKALKKKYPQAKISCLAVPRVREALEANPFVDEVIIYDEEGRDRFPWAKWNLIRRLAKENFEAAFLLHRSWTRALLIYLAGIPRRVGYDTKGRGKFLTDKVPPVKDGAHRSDVYLQVIESFGVKVSDRVCEWTVDSKSQQSIDEKLKSGGISWGDFLVVVHCGGNWDLKRWPKENFAPLINRLVREFQAKVIIPGGVADIPLAQEIAAQCSEKPLMWAGQTPLKELGALMKRASLVICADSGPLHIANAVGTSAIGLFGPTRPELTGPRGVGPVAIIQKDVGCNRVACYYLECPDNVCMRSISEEDVVREVQRLRH